MATLRITNNADYASVIRDGNTVAWYDYTDLTTITKTIDGSVSRWNDKLGSGRDLIQGTISAQPDYDASNGILFDGINDYMKTGAFTWNQPETIYIVFKQVTYTTPKRIFDGNSDLSGVVTQQLTTPRLRAYAGIVSLENANLAINTFGIMRVVFNKANSKLQINNTAPIIGDFGSSNMGGFTLASYGSAQGDFSNIQVKEIILRKVVDSPADEVSIYNYLSAKYSLNVPINANFKLALTNNVSLPVLQDGNTVAWYDYADLTTITKIDTSVSRWNDKLGSGRDLIQSTVANQPYYDATSGILFDGVNDFMKTGAFTWNQPESIYMVLNEISYSGSGHIFDGIASDRGRVYQTAPSPRIYCYAGILSAFNSNLVVGTTSILRLVLNQNASKLQINNTPAVTGNFGSANMGGFTLAARGSNDTFSNIQVKEIILRNVVDSPVDEATICNYLSAKYSLNVPISVLNTGIVTPYETESRNLFDRMAALGEPPTTSRAVAINNCIKSLKAADLFSNQFDVLVVTRGAGRASTKLNWIKSSHNAVEMNNGGTLTYTQDVGYNTDGSAYLRSVYIPSTNAITYKKDDACFVIKVSGTITQGAYGCMDDSLTYSTTIGHSGAYDYWAINTGPSGGSGARVVGYNGVTRNNITNMQTFKDSAGYATLNYSSTTLPAKELWLLRNNMTNNPFPVGNLEVLELYAMGRNITSAQRDTFKSIMDTYFATF